MKFFYAEMTFVLTNKVQMKNSAKNIAFWGSVLTGILLLFIGGRFFLLPEPATTAFGINVTTNGDHSFQYIKGIRDIFTGSIILLLLFTKELRALGFALLLGCIIPTVDFLIVLTRPQFDVNHLYAHLSAILICVPLGIYYLRISRRSLTK
jgi:hypothetical protein